MTAGFSLEVGYVDGLSRAAVDMLSAAATWRLDFTGRGTALLVSHPVRRSLLRVHHEDLIVRSAAWGDISSVSIKEPPDEPHRFSLVHVGFPEGVVTLRLQMRAYSARRTVAFWATPWPDALAKMQPA